jgi:tetratricopeptide (TPR) repeat protein
MNHAESNVWTGGGDFVGRDKHVYGDEVRGDKVTYVYQGLTYSHLDYRAEVAYIITSYADKFIGREREWAKLARFAGQEAPGYMLVEAPAGFGKTALMAHLIQRHEAGRWQYGPSPNLLYFFIREGGWRTPEIFLYALNSQLLTLLNQPGSVPPDLTSMRGQFSQLWPEALAAANSDHPLLLVVDGLDELAPGGVTIAHLLPADLTPYVHVVVTSRPNPEPLEQVTLTHPFKKADVLPLYAFEEPEIRALLQEYSAAEDIVISLTSCVSAMTKGEPLFARFVCQEVAKEGETALARLEQNPPTNVEAYFRQQFRQLDSLAEGDLAWDILGLLTVTLGGITVEEIAGVLGASKRRARKALEPIQRFLLGRDRLELMHLQLRKVVAEEFSPSEQAAYRGKVLGWCRRYQGQGWPQETPDYILAHYAQHLAEAGQREALYALIDRRWMDLKFKRSYSHRAFAEDVDRVIAVARVEGPPNLVQVVRGCLTYATLAELATKVPLIVFKVLTHLGQVERALDYAALIQDMRARYEAYSHISRALLEQGKMQDAITILAPVLVTPAIICDKPGGVVVLIEVMETLAKAREKRKATEVAKQVLSAVETIEDKDHNVSYELRRLTQALVPIGDRDLLNRVLAVAEKTGNEDARAEALSGVAQALAQAGERQRAAEVASRALAVAEAIGDEGRRAEALHEVAQALAQAGQFDRALAVAEAIGDEGRRAEALHEVAQALAQAGQFDRALAVAEGIGDEKARVFVLSKVARALAQAGEKEGATEVANQVLVAAEGIGAEDDRAYALGEVAQTLAQVGEKQRATEAANRAVSAAEMMYDEWMKALTLLWAARVLVQVGEKEKGTETASMAVAEAETIDDERRSRALGEVAWGLVRMGEEDRAAEVANWVLTVEGIGAEDDRAYALGEVAQALVQVGEKQKAADAANRALAAAEWIANEDSRGDVLIRLAEVLARAGQFDQALAIAEGVGSERRGLLSNWRIGDALCKVAQALAQVGEKQRAAEAANRALGVVEGIENERSRETGLYNVAPALVQAGLFDQALAVAERIKGKRSRAHALIRLAEVSAQAGQFDQALAVTEGLEDKWARARALCNVAQALVQGGEKQKAVDAANWALAAAEGIRVELYLLIQLAEVLAQAGQFDQALAVAEGIGDEEARAAALSGVAQALARVGERQRAAEVASQALAVTEGLEDKWARAYVLGEVAQALVQGGEKQKAVDAANWALAAAEGIEVEPYLLIQLAEVLAQAGQFDQALAVAEGIETADERGVALSKVPEVLAQAGQFDQALAVAEGIGDEEARSVALSKVSETIEDEWHKVHMLSGMNQLLIKTGQEEFVRRALRSAFTLIPLVGRKGVLRVLQKSAMALAGLDQGQTLWQVYQAVMEVESWWGPSSSR